MPYFDIHTMTIEEINALLAKAKTQPMTPAEKRLQRISWAYGNCSSNPNITREMVERIHDEMYGKPT